MIETIRLGARLRAARKAAGFKTSKDFLIKYKIPASTYSQHESGKRVPDDETLKFYCKMLKVSFNWLKSGEGHPFKKETSSQKTIISEELIDLSKYADINPDLLARILKSLLTKYDVHLSENKLKVISNETVKIYKRVIPLASGKNQHIKLLNKIFSSHK